MVPTSQGLAIEAQSISIECYLRKQLIHNVLEGPLTDLEDTSTDAGGDTPVAPQGPGGAGNGSRIDPGATPGPVLTRKEKRALNRAQRRRVERSQRPRGSSGGKQVGVRRVTEGKEDSLVLPTDMASSTKVTSSGWVGRSLRSLPRQVLTGVELENRRGMRLFPWDGVCVCLLPFFA
jgi:hypothetical protein